MFKRFLIYIQSLLNPEFAVHGNIGPGDLSQKDLKKLLILSQSMTEFKDLDELLSHVLGEIKRQFDVDCGVMMLEQDQVLKIRSHKGFSAELVRNFHVPLGQGPVGECFSSGRKAVLSRKLLLDNSIIGEDIKNEKWHDFFIAPVSLESQTLGVFLAGCEEPDFFSGKMIDILDPFIQVLSVGIRNVQLVERIEKFNRRLEAEVAATTQELTRTNTRLIHRVRELKALYEITLAAGTSSSLEDIFEAVAVRVQDLFNVESVGFFIDVSQREDRTDLALQPPSFGLPDAVHPVLRLQSNQYKQCGSAMKKVMDAYIMGEIKIFRGGPVSLRDELPREISSAFADDLKKIIFRSFVAVPLKTSHKTLGVIVLVNLLGDSLISGAPDATREDFTEEQAQTLTLIALRVAASIENVRMGLEIQRRLTDLSTLHEIGEAFYATPVLEFVLGRIVKIVLKSLPCDICTFMFIDPTTGELISQLSSFSSQTHNVEIQRVSLKDESKVSNHVVREGKSMIVDDIRKENIILSRMEMDQNVSSMMFVPLKVENEIIGVIRLGSIEKGFFNHGHLRLSELIADRAAVIVQNARLYEKILHANQELERLNRVKTEFVSMVSHELRTPVTAIKGFVDIVLNGDAGLINDQQKRFLKIAHNSIDRLTLIISDLLDISRIESGQIKLELSKISIARALEDAVVTYRNAVESKGIQFRLEMDKELPNVYADESRIKQVIDNLLSNAMKFTPVNGTIRILTDDMGDFVLVSVSDTGVGIRKENHEKIFDKFFQVDSSLTRQVGGSGLGLAISKAIIEMHGGRIWVESETGKGATFRFLLPRLREHQVSSLENPKQEKSSSITSFSEKSGQTTQNQ